MTGVIRQLDADDRHEAAALLARAMRDNPLHLRVFGTDEGRREARLRRFFAVLLGHVLRHGYLLGVSSDARFVGVLGLIRPGHCRPKPFARLRMGMAMVATLPPTTALLVWRWLRAWERLDPETPHWHVGPLAVCPDHRRQGIATVLMQEGCRLIDLSDPAPAWLETDLDQNTRFYRRFGFDIAHQDRVLDVPNWFMIRRAKTESPA